FLAGLAFQVPTNLPGGIKPVTSSGLFTSSASAVVTVQWKWGAAVYTSFSTNYNALGVKPVDDNDASMYHNSDHAGTPENFKPYVIGGATGGGGSNWTGSYSGTAAVTPCPGVNQLADGGENHRGFRGGLTDEQLQPLVREAIARWGAAGVTP